MYLIFTHRFACKKWYKFNLFFVLTERLTIYEECDVDMQCNGTYVGGVCKKIGHRKLCLCENGYIEDKADLICRKGNIIYILKIL